MKRNWYFALPLLLAVVVLVGLSRWSDQTLGPIAWAKNAPIDHSVVGTAKTDWARLGDHISDGDLGNVGKDQILTVLEQRSPGQQPLPMPIPYRQWVSEQARPWWMKLL
jgi:hypothetical protein